MESIAKAMVEDIVSILPEGSEGGWKYVLEHSTLFTEIDLEASQALREQRKCEDKQCYYNCQTNMDMADYDYYEGHAVSSGGFPVPHAWLVRRSDGKVIDPTWIAHLGEKSEWFGMQIPTNWVRNNMLETETAMECIWKYVIEQAIAEKEAEISEALGV